MHGDDVKRLGSDRAFLWTWIFGSDCKTFCCYAAEKCINAWQLAEKSRENQGLAF